MDVMFLIYFSHNFVTNLSSTKHDLQLMLVAIINTSDDMPAEDNAVDQGEDLDFDPALD